VNGRGRLLGFPSEVDMDPQRTRTPCSETPFDVFDQGVLTQRTGLRAMALRTSDFDRPDDFKIAIRGHANKTSAWTLDEIARTSSGSRSLP